MKTLAADVKQAAGICEREWMRKMWVGFEPQESHVQSTSTSQRILMCRRKGVFAVQLDSKARSQKKIRSTKSDEPNENEKTPIKCAGSVTNDAREVRERCKTREKKPR